VPRTCTAASPGRWPRWRSDELRAEWEPKFLANLHAGAIGAGRIMSAAGTDIQATLINCFVQPVGDCIQGFGRRGLPRHLRSPARGRRDHAPRRRRGLRLFAHPPARRAVKGTASMASGPCSYINVFDQSCSTVESAGARRGAQMGVLRIDHPDVLEFITAKRTPGRWNNFNVSVGVPDTFMQALRPTAPGSWCTAPGPAPSQLAQGAHQREDGLWVYQTLPPASCGTPSCVGLRLRRAGHPVPRPDQRGQQPALLRGIEATNPCGEQPLPPYGCCDLGPIILTRFVRHPFGFGGVPGVRLRRLRAGGGDCRCARSTTCWT
jgi:ribonucleoside-diphosphate reductase alpha chain